MKSEKNIKIVIGSNYGDEGKGLATDYFASQHPNNGVVVLTNGGSQRAHTVELKDGTRHVFQHFGSGTLRGWDTYFSEHFILNPMQFCKEYEEIKKIYSKPFRVYCNPECMWSTPYDMIYNQIERALNGRHDTCGMGIWTTIQRYEYFKTNNIQTYKVDEINRLKAVDRYKYFYLIRDYYNSKIKRLVKSPENHPLISKLYLLLNDKNIMSHFAADIMQMNNIIGIFGFCNPLYLYDNIIMENGQGLLLDTDVDILFGTPSHTGLDTPLEIINKDLATAKNVNIEVCYVTRTYLTRHGFGNIKDGCSHDSINMFMNDETNVFNEFQGSLSYGKLNIHDLYDRIRHDFNKIVYQNKNNLIQPHFYRTLFVTHMNEYEIGCSDFYIPENECTYLSDTKYADDINKRRVG